MSINPNDDEQEDVLEPLMDEYMNIDWLMHGPNIDEYANEGFYHKADKEWKKDLEKASPETQEFMGFLADYPIKLTSLSEFKKAKVNWQQSSKHGAPFGAAGAAAKQQQQASVG